MTIHRVDSIVITPSGKSYPQSWDLANLYRNVIANGNTTVTDKNSDYVEYTQSNGTIIRFYGLVEINDAG